MVFLTRRYRFSAAHRLHNEALSTEENARLYGKCNNPYGHGHNYTVEVTVCGPIDASTGMLIDLETLDRIVEQEILERFDHAHLNLDVANFKGRVPTTENLCVEIFNLLWDKLNGRGLARLEKVRLEETSSNFVEYMGQSPNPVKGVISEK
ncbi:MAG: 6-carboxytetrahydropterin synthase [Acidobacteria bacterium]|nr:6-carboxytetrahydropterin synthase [Acidobacteriota bacterium]